MRIEQENEPVRPHLDHPNNINVGNARLIWATEVKAIEGLRGCIPAGWVLPGGARTVHRDVAMDVAISMNELMKGQRNGCKD